jgi:hypothetical protein
MLECGHATGSAASRSSSSIGVSMPSEEWHRRRLWKISRYSNRALASSRRVSPALPVEQFVLDQPPRTIRSFRCRSSPDRAVHLAFAGRVLGDIGNPQRTRREP